MTPPEIEKAAQSASIRIINSGDDIIIKQVFDIKNKSNIGVLILLVGSIFLLYMGIARSGELIYKTIFILLGLFMLMFSLLAFISQFSDRIVLTSNSLNSYYHLKKNRWEYNGGISVKMKTETVIIKRVNSPLTHFFCVIHCYVRMENAEVRIFTFQMDNRYRKEAIALGEYLTKIINDRIVAAKQSITILPT